MTRTRIGRLRREIKAHRLDAFLVSALPHVRYLTGFSGTNGLSLVAPRRHLFLSDSRYSTQAGREVSGARIHITARDLFAQAGATVTRKAARIGFESEYCSVHQFRKLRAVVGASRLVPLTGVMEEIVAVKHRSEVSAMTRAARISEKVLVALLPMIRPGVRELDLAAEISYQHKRHGAEGDSFPPIVASGPRSALPHARAGRNRIRAGQIVLLDFGCTVDGYHSDMTRCVVVGNPSPRIRAMHAAVLEAAERAREAIRPGVRVSVLDAVARRTLAAHRLGSYFIHSLGHGIGLSVHERPRISSLSTETIVRGNVVTIEPGVYRPGVGGVRIEDMVVVTATGHRLITRADRSLIVV